MNGSHQIVIVASSLDASTERIVNYLSEMDVPINVSFFQVFQDGENQYLSRVWLIDPVETEGKAIARTTETRGEWNGEYYVSFGQDDQRQWDEAVKYGFVSAGGGVWYSQTLRMLSPGDRIWVNIPRHGYVGVGRVIGPAVRAADFRVMVDGTERSIVDVAKAGYLRELADDQEKSEYFVPVHWIVTRPLSEAISEVGFFGNQNTVCRPTASKWVHTVERLKQRFPMPIGT